jgi:pre-mRNA-splicing factor SYF1
MDMRLVTTTRRTFDRALAALPITQHDRVWVLYLVSTTVARGRAARMAVGRGGGLEGL